jgi:hypothetical protein
VTARWRKSKETLLLHISNGANWCSTAFYLREIYCEKIHMKIILPNHWFRLNLTKIAAALTRSLQSASQPVLKSRS